MLLTGRSPAVALPRRGDRSPIRPAVLVPTARALLRTPAPAIVVLVAVPVTLTVMRGGHDLSLAVVTTALLGGVAAAFAVEDAAGPTTAACPTSLLLRRAGRLAVVTSAVLGAWAVAGLAALLSDASLGALGPRAVEAAAAAGLALACASWSMRGRDDSAGLTGAAAALLAMLTSTGMAMRYRWLPMLGMDDHTSRWAWIAAASWLVAAWFSRDPASRAPSVSLLRSSEAGSPRRARRRGP